MRGTFKKDLRVGESFRLSGDGVTVITLLAKTGQRSRFEIAADEAVEIQVIDLTPSRPRAPLGLGDFKS
jgi:hypothetical protein